MRLFVQLNEDAQVILRVKGLFRQARCFTLGDDLFAAYGSGFVRLYVESGTSRPDVVVVDHPFEPKHYSGTQFRAMVLTEAGRERFR